MPTLAERLKSLGVKTGAQDLPPPKKSQAHPIEEVMPGRFAQTPDGAAYIVETAYDDGYQHGRYGLQPKTALDTIAEWSGEAQVAQLPHQAFAFLDTETSGLAGGSGTYAFLVGIGKFSESGFSLAQFFLRDPLEESALLLAVEEFIAPCQAMVTFNGKSFDIPLLNARYTMQGWQSPFRSLAHVDLLHLARRLWRDRLPSRTLSSLEAQILGTERSDEEIPGWMIPQMYFDYLRDGDARPMKRVFYHNAMDVLSMAALLNHTAQMLEAPFDFQAVHCIEQAAIARLNEALGHPDEAVQLYERSLQGDLPQELFNDTLERLALLHKRQGHFPLALPLWERAAQEGQLFAFEELAKYYEHHARDLGQALHWTNAALAHLDGPGTGRLERLQNQPEFLHRQERLLRKQEALKSCSANGSENRV